MEKKKKKKNLTSQETAHEQMRWPAVSMIHLIYCSVHKMIFYSLSGPVVSFWVALSFDYFLQLTAQVWSVCHLFFQSPTSFTFFPLMQILIYLVFILPPQPPTPPIFCRRRALPTNYSVWNSTTPNKGHFFPSTSACKGERALTPGSNKRPTLREKIR